MLFLGTFLVLSMVWGYQLEVARQVAVDPEPPAPRLGKVGRHLRDGLKGSVVIGAVVAPGVGLFVLGSMLRRSVPIVSALAVTSAVGLLLVAAYVLPAALTVLATTDHIRSALQPDGLLDIVDTEDYAVAWVVGTSMRLGGLVLVTSIVGVILWFYVEIASTYVYAIGFSRLDMVDGNMGTGERRTHSDGGTPMDSTSGGSGVTDGPSGDTEVYRTNPGWRNWQLLLTFGLLVIVAGVFSKNETIGLLLVLFALVIFGYVYLARANSRYIVTDSRVRKEWGTVRRQTTTVAIDDITATSVEQSWLGRVVGDGHVRIQSGSIGGVLTLNHVPHPDSLVEAIQTQMD